MRALSALLLVLIGAFVDCAWLATALATTVTDAPTPDRRFALTSLTVAVTTAASADERFALATAITPTAIAAAPRFELATVRGANCAAPTVALFSDGFE
ncbi:MAG: hypothetical protein COS34_07255 [Lysobacterales bacterium CG02_land_8_20_14_3_00_62_12]|nr:MAG: hypothetical protein COS34_07255 [Xanthomonadales bacterium CG02_land_8_20_14_3_00_62_12]